MRRIAILFVLLTLALGCDRSARSPGAPTSSTDVNSAADLPKIQPKLRFKLPGERSSDIWVRPQISADGKRLAVGYRAPKFTDVTQVWDFTGELRVVAEFEASNYALSPSGKLLLISAGLDVYDLESKKPIARLPAVFSHAVFLDDQILVATRRSYDFSEQAKGRITIWNIAENADAGSFDIPDNRFSDAILVRERNELWLFMSKSKFEVECYDLGRKMLVRTIKPEQEDPSQPYTDSGSWNAISPAVTAFAATTIKTAIYDSKSGKIIGQLPANIFGTAPGFLPGWSWFLARPTNSDSAKKLGLAATDFIVCDWSEGKNLAALVGHGAGEEDLLAAVSADGKTLVSVSKKGEGLVFDLGLVK